MAERPLSVGIIGAGIAGLSCARRLVELGHAATVLDKGRRVGGRCATRRSRLDDGSTLAFDHGAQFATARGQEFSAMLAKGKAREWRADRLVPTPTMRALPEAMAQGLTVSLEVEVASIERDSDAWRLSDRAGVFHGPFDRVVCTAPAPQSALLFPDVAERLAGVRIAPCWALMVGFEEPWAPGFDLREDLGDIGLVAREGAKPGREAMPDRWIVHATPTWSRQHLECEKEDARALLLAALSKFSPTPPITHAAAHRWRYARVEAPLGAPFLKTDSGAVLAGDWCLGARLEAAFESGRAAADHVGIHS